MPNPFHNAWPWVLLCSRIMYGINVTLRSDKSGCFSSNAIKFERDHPSVRRELPGISNSSASELIRVIEACILLTLFRGPDEEVPDFIRFSNTCISMIENNRDSRLL